jgi:hypothetical protein
MITHSKQDHLHNLENDFYRVGILKGQRVIWSEEKIEYMLEF